MANIKAVLGPVTVTFSKDIRKRYKKDQFLKEMVKAYTYTGIEKEVLKEKFTVVWEESPR